MDYNNATVMGKAALMFSRTEALDCAWLQRGVMAPPSMLFTLVEDTEESDEPAAKKLLQAEGALGNKR